MTLRPACLLGIVLIAAPSLLRAQANLNSVNKQLDNLQTMTDQQRPAPTMKLAMEIRSLPPGPAKLVAADQLAHQATQGGPDKDTISAVAQTLAVTIVDSPPTAQGDRVPGPFFDLARLIRYDHATVDSPALTDPNYARAVTALETSEASLQGQDFTVKDLKGKTWTLSQLKGKIVILDFFMPQTPSCARELAVLNSIYKYFEPKGLVVIGLSSEDLIKVSTYINTAGIAFPVVIDFGGKISRQFHVDGNPRAYVFDKDGKYVTQSIDMQSQKQLLTMLQQAGMRN